MRVAGRMLETAATVSSAPGMKSANWGTTSAFNGVNTP